MKWNQTVGNDVTCNVLHFPVVTSTNVFTNRNHHS